MVGNKWECIYITYFTLERNNLFNINIPNSILSIALSKQQND